jgi:hypothetical protein
MRSHEECGVVPRKQRRELDVETRCVGFSPGSSVKATKRWKVASKFPEKRNKKNGGKMCSRYLVPTISYVSRGVD